MNVLSIDFDFFPNVSKEQLNMYPDGIDLPPKLSDLVWSSKYELYGEKLETIEINKHLINRLLHIFFKQERHIPVMVANSHVNAYDFIQDVRNKRYVELVNVDFHHDYISNNKILDCGNWISFLEKDGCLSKLKWICRPLSLEMYGFSKEELIEKIACINYNFKSIAAIKFDAIFICRSDPWFPPHLDVEFETFLNVVRFLFKNLQIEPRVREPRKLPLLNVQS